MNIKDFTDQQKHALLDLAMLAMYSDGNLSSAEDARVHRLLGSMGYDSDYDRNKHYDASVSRVSRHTRNAEAAGLHAVELAKHFPTREQRRYVASVLEDFVTSDRHISLQENSLLSAVREALQM